MFDQPIPISNRFDYYGPESFSGIAQFEPSSNNEQMSDPKFLATHILAPAYVVEDGRARLIGLSWVKNGQAPYLKRKAVKVPISYDISKRVLVYPK